MATIDTSEEVRSSAPANPPRENLVRATPGINLERAEGAAMPTLTGHFAVWDQWTEIRSSYEGNFMERFSASSMTKTLSERRPKVMFNHGKDPSIGEKLLGTPERLEPDSEGAFYAVPLFDTSYNRDLLPGLDAGEYGASFRFSVVREDVVQKPPRSEHNPRGIPERTVQEARVMEFGPVSFPAYQGATAGLRSMTDEYLFDSLVDDPERLRDLCQRAGLRLVPEFASGGHTGLALLHSNEYIVPANGANSTGRVTINIGGDTAAIARALTIEPEQERDSEPDPPEDTTPDTDTEPEPSEATTYSSRGLFWFADYTPSTKE